jgi:L-alanine-DL-glutamate epimerase-like enolase superfamily enzyme
VWRLLGGRRHDSLPCYATGGPSNYPLERLEAKVTHYLGLGFRAVKLGAGSYTAGGGFHVPSEPAEAAEFEAAKLDFIRTRFGESVQMLLDAHMGNSHSAIWDLATALAVARALENCGLGFLEEPLPYTDPAAYAELCRATSIPVAGGECLTAACEWIPFVDAGAFDIGQPDASYTGGLGEFMRIAALFSASGRAIATHAWGAAGSLMQNIHCGFAAPNTAILEVAPDFGGLHSEILDGAFVMRGGRVLPPEAPGLGIRLTPQIEQRYPFVPGSGEFVSVPGKLLVDA